MVYDVEILPYASHHVGYLDCCAGAAMLHHGCLNYGIRSSAVDASRLIYVENIPNTLVAFVTVLIEPLEQFAFTFQKSI